MISVIVPAYNAEGTLGACLDALHDQTAARESYEVIVVDDGSTDRTVETAWRYPVRLVQQANAGPAAARNAGARVARGELLLFTDADCAPTPQWVTQMAKPFLDPHVAGAKGIYRTSQQELVPRFVQLEYESRYARLRRQGCIDFIDTYSAAYRREVFMANGGFDTLFTKASVEDQELSYRLARKGYRLVFAPQAIVYHKHDRTVGEYWRRKLGIGHWKAVLLRWHPERAVRDSHTPQLLKFQIGLLAFVVPVSALAALWSPARWGLVALAAAFGASTLPFLVHIARRDPAVLLVAPWLVLIRALGLGIGLVTGFLRRPPQDAAHNPALRAPQRIAKRALDLAVSALGLLATAPLLGALAIAGRIRGSRELMAKETRVGAHGRAFEIVNLAPTALPADGRSRVARLFLRWGIDRLPQLWNVVRGDMSLVGPHPETPAAVIRYTDAQRERFVVRPGMTGPAHVRGGHALGWDERIRLELDYVRGYSFRGDLRILAKTARIAMRGRDGC